MSRKSQRLLQSFLRELAGMSAVDFHVIQSSCIFSVGTSAVPDQKSEKIKLPVEGEDPLVDKQVH